MFKNENVLDPSLESSALSTRGRRFEFEVSLPSAGCLNSWPLEAQWIHGAQQGGRLRKSPWTSNVVQSFFLVLNHRTPDPIFKFDSLSSMIHIYIIV